MSPSECRFTTSACLLSYGNPFFITCIFVSILFLFPALIVAQEVTTEAGVRAGIDSSSGHYRVSLRDGSWSFGGSIGSSVHEVSKASGVDGIGEYVELSFNLASASPMQAIIRVYRRRPVVLFTEKFIAAVESTQFRFPSFTKIPQGLHSFRYSGDIHLRPALFDADLPENSRRPYSGPIVLFDGNGNACVISPASDFMVSEITGDLINGFSSGFNAQLRGIPAGFIHRTIVVFDRGITTAFDSWGHTLTDFYRKKRPANDADNGLKYLGYWTDNGSHYYYNYDIDKGYAASLLAVKDHFETEGIPLRYMQLDSWWYPKTFTNPKGEKPDSGKMLSKNRKLPSESWNRYGGMLEYKGHPALFPEGLAGFHRKLGLPLITHDRWLDRESPYRSTYKISGVAVIDSAWWHATMSNVASWGVKTYEQDWLNEIYWNSPEIAATTYVGEAFMGNMAAATSANGLTMQYCMVMPQYVMQGGAKYSNLTTVRISDDRFKPAEYKLFLYNSLFVRSLGIYPWSDVFRSRETSNILLATLSAGMVGLADSVGEENKSNILKAVRADGVIIKPDVPMTPTDATFIRESRRSPGAFVAATYTEFPQENLRAWYVFAFDSASFVRPDTKMDIEFSPSELGMNGRVFVYDYFKEIGKSYSAKDSLREEIRGEAWKYYVVVPFLPSGIALVGDIGKFVPCGKKRISALRSNGASTVVTVAFVPGDTAATILGNAPKMPSVKSTKGIVVDRKYDPSSAIFRLTLAPSKNIQWIDEGGDKVAYVEFELTLK